MKEFKDSNGNWHVWKRANTNELAKAKETEAGKYIGSSKTLRINGVETVYYNVHHFFI